MIDLVACFVTNVSSDRLRLWVRSLPRQIRAQKPRHNQYTRYYDYYNDPTYCANSDENFFHAVDLCVQKVDLLVP